MGEIAPMHNEVLLYGASGHARVIIDILERSGITVGGLVDDNEAVTELDGYAVRRRPVAGDQIIISIGNNRIRKKIAAQLAGSNFALAIHPSAVIASHTRINEGTVIMANVAINPGAVLGKHVIVNTNASVDHDCEIDDYVHISPNVALCGNVRVGEGTHIGAGAVVIPGIRIGRWCTIGAGSVVIRDVPDGTTLVGNPGKIIKKERT